MMKSFVFRNSKSLSKATGRGVTFSTILGSTGAGLPEAMKAPCVVASPPGQTTRNRDPSEATDTRSKTAKGFRGSEAYDRWRALLHHFYEPFPTVEHYETVIAR